MTVLRSRFVDLAYLLIIMALIVCSSFLLGCKLKELPLSENALVFQEEMRATIKKLSLPFTESASRGDLKGVEAALNKIYEDGEKSGQPLNYGLGVLDKNGVMLAGRYPGKPDWSFSLQNYSKYKVITQALKERKVIQTKLFMQNEPVLYVICVPLLREKKVEGLLIVGFSSSQMKEKLGISEEEFMTMNFN